MLSGYLGFGFVVGYSGHGYFSGILFYGCSPGSLFPTVDIRAMFMSVTLEVVGWLAFVVQRRMLMDWYRFGYFGLMH